MRDFKGKVAVVTGAASGIGRATAQALAAEGCSVALADVDESGLDEAAAEIERAGAPKVTRHRIDVSDRGAMESLPETVVAEHGRVDILVNNAGVSVAATLQDHSIEDFEWIVGINLWGVIYGCKFFLPHLQRSDDAYIVNLSSVFGLVGVPGQSSYCLTKFGVRGFSEALAAEFVDSSVRVMSVHPGGVRTNIAKATRFSSGHAHIRDRTIAFFETRTWPPERVAQSILKGMRAGVARVVVTPEAHLADAIKRLFPVLPPRWLAKTHAWVTRS